MLSHGAALGVAEAQHRAALELALAQLVEDVVQVIEGMRLDLAVHLYSRERPST